MHNPSTLDCTKEEGKEVTTQVTAMLADVVARNLAAQVIEAMASKAG